MSVTDVDSVKSVRGQTTKFSCTKTMPKPLNYHGRKRSKSEGAIFTHIVQIGDIRVQVPDAQTHKEAVRQVADVMALLDQAAFESLGQVKSVFH